MARALGVSVRSLKGREAVTVGGRGIVFLVGRLAETFGVSTDWRIGNEIISDAYRDEIPVAPGGVPLPACRWNGFCREPAEEVREGRAGGVTRPRPGEIWLLRFYQAADDRTKAAMLRMAERMTVEKMPFEIAAGLFKLEIAGADPDTIAAWRRQRLRS